MFRIIFIYHLDKETAKSHGKLIKSASMADGSITVWH